MITAFKIKELALKKYEQILKSILNEENLFPLSIPFPRIKSSETQSNYNEINGIINELESESKTKKGFGYSVNFKIIEDRKIGKRKNPEKIYFETLEDYLQFIEKKKEVEEIRINFKKVNSNLPQLKEWLIKNPTSLMEYDTKWDELIKVCMYFRANPKPNLYIRELPIEVDTKFIEKNERIIDMFLSLVLKDKDDFTKQKFEDKFFLKSDFELVRFRSLDKELCFIGNKKIYEMLLSYKDFSDVALAVEKIFIVENKITYLAFPKCKNAICIWGKGFFVEELKNCAWLKNKEIFYFGDMDVSGYLIFARTRSIFPNAKSILMSKELFFKYEHFAVNDEKSKKVISIPKELNEEETEIFEILNQRKEKNRLEQERIPQTEIERYFRNSGFLSSQE